MVERGRADEEKGTTWLGANDREGGTCKPYYMYDGGGKVGGVRWQSTISDPDYSARKAELSQVYG